MIRWVALAALASVFSLASSSQAEPRAWDLTPHEKQYSELNEELVIRHFLKERRDVVAKYFAKHGYERLEEYVPYDSLNHYYAPRTR